MHVTKLLLMIVQEANGIQDLNGKPKITRTKLAASYINFYRRDKEVVDDFSTMFPDQ